MQHQRQDLIGGRYGLLAIDHDDEALGHSSTLHIQPDFWVNFLWKRIVGPIVLNLTATNTMGRTVRSYAFCGRPPSPHAALGASSDATMSLVLINLNDHTAGTGPVLVALAGAAAYTTWTMTPGAGGPFGSDTLLNGKQLPTAIRDGVSIHKIPVAGIFHVSGATPVELPPISVTFVLAELDDPGLACIAR